MHNIPRELIYTNNHVWIEHVGDDRYRVGITDFAQSELGDIVFVEMPETDREYSQEDECTVIESVKSTSDIFCPISGTMIEVNPILEDTPEVINNDPYGDGWIFIIESNDNAELGGLLDADAYTQFTKEE